MDEAGLEVVRQWRPPERPLRAAGFPAGTSQIPGAWWALRRGDDDVVQAWTAPAALAAAHSGKPSVYVFQGLLHEDDFAGRPRLRSLVMRAARGCDAVVAYSDTAARAFSEITGVAAEAIEPGVDLDAFTPGGERHAAPAIFCAADPDEPRKRVRLLVDAFARLRETRSDAELWLMATSDPAIAAAPGVRIVEPGADQAELIRLYRAAWMTVLPAYREAFGLVVAESLACGTPALVTTDGGGALTLGAGSAEPDAAALAGALAAAIASPPDSATASACRTRAEGFGIGRCADRYVALYERLARGR